MKRLRLAGLFLGAALPALAMARDSYWLNEEMNVTLKVSRVGDGLQVKVRDVDAENKRARAKVAEWFGIEESDLSAGHIYSFCGAELKFVELKRKHNGNKDNSTVGSWTGAAVIAKPNGYTDDRVIRTVWEEEKGSLTTTNWLDTWWGRLAAKTIVFRRVENPVQPCGSLVGPVEVDVGRQLINSR